jgi:hypothetical protein
MVTVRRATHADTERLLELAASWPGGSHSIPFLGHPDFCILVALDELTGSLVGYADALAILDGLEQAALSP